MAGRWFDECSDRDPENPGRSNPGTANGWQATPADKEQARCLAVIKELTPRAWIVEEIRDGEKLKAVKICSAVVEDHLWAIIDRSFTPADGLACYYPGELDELRNKTAEELCEIHKVKLTFPDAG